MLSVQVKDSYGSAAQCYDDQGYGDLGYTGNPWVQTPHLDALAAESVVFENFHVQPLCTPTRGALMTGRNPLRNGAWGTAWGHSLLHSDERTLADYFQAGGHRTVLFGKWHLGDQAPFRPWEEALIAWWPTAVAG